MVLAEIASEFSEPFVVADLRVAGPSTLSQQAAVSTYKDPQRSDIEPVQMEEDCTVWDLTEPVVTVWVLFEEFEETLSSGPVS
ncbi:hypothetical protein CQY22_017800 [Mycolicibacterium brumae]|uniref:Uncharacterized protein n=1 Tax=Mycolicibacterium brumae TaxID=85968 RepID=A0A2G5P4M4_9MYCO|nr:hypothetical protein CQY22_017800 [Mycolicibacterium brumae]RWA17826.1 hypothetical protein MBRU_18500 [Mycolicibacterium brumae DSM 44177]